VNNVQIDVSDGVTTGWTVVDMSKGVPQIDVETQKIQSIPLNIHQNVHISKQYSIIEWDWHSPSYKLCLY